MDIKQMNLELVRNFSIIAHIDHGKSTLADRLIQTTGIVCDRDFQDQVLDNMEIERERGITIKSQSINLPYTAKDGINYSLNLIDTPGHADFSYEVSRALASCEGALLLVDASQGVEAQTIANLYLAMEHDLEIIPVINKIDLPSADVNRIKKQLDSNLGLDPERAVLTSAKNGIGIDDLLETIVKLLPAPKGSLKKPLRALIFDSSYDSFRGTIVHLRLIDGSVKPGDMIQFMSNGKVYKVEETGLFQLSRKPMKSLSAGQVGYIIAGIKTVNDTRCGDTITLQNKPCKSAMAGFKNTKPVVFSSIYPVSADCYDDLTIALEKLKLNDASLVYEKDVSAALGFGFRCGFLGLLHLEVIQERLEREYNLAVILTAPSVSYEVNLRSKEQIVVDNPAFYPEITAIDSVSEPFVRASIIVPDKYMGSVMKLCIEKRGISKNYQYITSDRLEMIFEMPLSEIVHNFYDNLKSITQGYASLDYSLIDYRETDLVKLDILINGEKVDALSQLVHKSNAVRKANFTCIKLKDQIPRQMYKIAIQGAIGSKIISRSNVSAFRKDVTAKCYGGDITRKRKLLEKQREGKKRMKMVGKIVIPQSAFLSLLKTS